MTAGRPAALAALGALLFVPLFAFGRAGPLDFWTWMSAAAAAAVGLAAALDPGVRAELRGTLRRPAGRAILGGVLSAGALYAAFALGSAVLRRLLPGAAPRIESVYALREGASVARIVLLLLFVIGPAEEIFWRAGLQRAATDRWGPAAGVLGATAVYAAVHLPTGNPLLVAAAGICGLFWGAMYARWRSLTANIVSHALWDVLVFVVAPV